MSKILCFIGGGLLGYLAKSIVDGCSHGGPIKDLPPYSKRTNREYYTSDDSKATPDDEDATPDKDPDQSE